MRIALWTYVSPIGALGLATDEAGVVVGCSFEGSEPLARTMRRHWPQAEIAEGSPVEGVRVALNAYFRVNARRLIASTGVFRARISSRGSGAPWPR